jgi:hypothetical protein
MEKRIDTLIKSLKIVQSVLIVTLFFFLLAVLFLVNMENLPSLNLANAQVHMIISVVILIFVASVLGGQALFKNRLKIIREQQISQQLERYRETFIMRSSFVEMNGFVALVCYYLLAHNTFIILAGLSVLLMLLFFPSKRRMLSDLQLKEQDISDSEE